MFIINAGPNLKYKFRLISQQEGLASRLYFFSYDLTVESSTHAIKAFFFNLGPEILNNWFIYLGHAEGHANGPL